MKPAIRASLVLLVSLTALSGLLAPAQAHAVIQRTPTLFAEAIEKA
jgi:hypothetical protein